jgi:hypothetical protein
MSTNKRCGTVPCKGCPFLRANQGLPTKEGFYTVKNLRRLWSGVRTGEIMICHSTDPNAHETGSPAHPKPGQIKPGSERVCLGALFLYKREERLMAEVKSYKAYRTDPRAAKPPMTKVGFLSVAEAVLFKELSGPGIQFLMPDMTADVALPWEK